MADSKRKQKMTVSQLHQEKRNRGWPHKQAGIQHGVAHTPNTESIFANLPPLRTDEYLLSGREEFYLTAPFYRHPPPTCSSVIIVRTFFLGQMVSMLAVFSAVIGVCLLCLCLGVGQSDQVFCHFSLKNLFSLVFLYWWLVGIVILGGGRYKLHQLGAICLIKLLFGSFDKTFPLMVMSENPWNERKDVGGAGIWNRRYLQGLKIIILPLFPLQWLHFAMILTDVNISKEITEVQLVELIGNGQQGIADLGLDKRNTGFGLREAELWEFLMRALQMGSMSR